MDFFKDKVSINGVDYVCKISAQKILIPCSDADLPELAFVCEDDDIVVNGSKVQVLKSQVVESFGLWGRVRKW